MEVKVISNLLPASLRLLILSPSAPVSASLLLRTADKLLMSKERGLGCGASEVKGGRIPRYFIVRTVADKEEKN
jgi:hypothetical protein